MSATSFSNIARKRDGRYRARPLALRWGELW